MKVCKKSLALILSISLIIVMISVMSIVSFAESTFTAAVYKSDFVNPDGTFNTAAEGFPENYAFDFTATTSNVYKMNVPKAFFHAAKSSGKSVILVDNLGAKFIFNPEDIVDIDPSEFEQTVYVGGRYRDTSSYINVGKNIASTNMGINSNDYNHKVNFGFLQFETGNGIATNCEIRFVMNFKNADDTDTANLFYNLAKNNSLYVYQYSSNTLTPRPVELAKALTSPEISITKPESGEMQFMFSDRPLKMSDVENSSAAPYSDSFVNNGEFVVSAPGFPANYTFTFGSYSKSSPGFKKDLFQAIKNSGREVTLIDRFNIKYIFDGSTMSDLSAATRDEFFQLQSLYKTSNSYQTVMGKIAGLSKIYDGFYINQDYIILDIQPETNVGVDINNTFPSPATIELALNNGVAGTEGQEIAERFAQYARDGVLKAFFYDKTAAVQDIFTDKEPLVPTATEDGKIRLNVTEPCTLIFTQKDLIAGRFAEIDTNPYRMRIKKDGKNMSDGYTIELGDVQYFELTMDEGNINDYTYEWDVIGPGADSITIEPVEDANNLIYKVTAVKESGKPFQVRVRIVGENDNFVTTGMTTVVDSVFGKTFVENGKFDTSASGFPEDLLFTMPSSKYQITGEFLNAIATSKSDVTLVDSSNIRYVFNGAKMDPVPEEDWATTYPVKALYKDSASYQDVMKLIAYQRDIFEFENNKDYIIIDFQAHGVDLPFEIDIEFLLESKSRDAEIAKHFADAFRDGNLYVYAYSKSTQNIYRPVKGLSLIDGTDMFTMKLESPTALVFTTHKLMDDISEDWDSEDDYNDQDTEMPDDENNDNPATGDSSAVLAIVLLAISSAFAAVVLRRKGRVTR